MRKNIGVVLVGIGAALLLIGVMGAAWAPGKVKKTPLDVDSTTRLEGEVAAVQTDMETMPVKAVNLTLSDSKASTDKTVVFVGASCLMIDEPDAPECSDDPEDPLLISASDETFAADRVTGLAADSDKLPADAETREGLINKFPFDTEKKTYPYWDSVLKAPVDAVYTKTAKVYDVETYVFTVTIDSEQTDIAEGVPGVYSDVKTIYVEPKTGAILNQTDDQQRETADGTPVIDLQLAFTADQQKESAADAKDNIAQLSLITKTVPLVGFIGGILLIGAGAFLVLTGRRGQRSA